MKKIKKKLLALGLLAVTLPAVVAPVVSCSTVVQNKSYQFEGQNFNSEDDVKNYAYDKLTQQQISSKTNNQIWTVNTNGTTNRYNDPYLLKLNVEQNIETLSVTTSLDTKDVLTETLGPNGEMPAQIVSKIIQSKSDSKLIKVYRGRNNSYFTSEIEAKKSYLNNHEGYYFNNIYFSNIESLKYYIDQNYNDVFGTNSGNTVEYKVLESPSGAMSEPINNSNPEEAKQKVAKFVKSNYKDIYSIKDSTGTRYFSDITTQELANNLTLSDVDPIIMHKNPQGTYIVDTHRDDSNNFYGPYFYNGSADVLKITDKTLWKEMDQSDRDILNSSRENNFIQNFFTLLVNDIDSKKSLFGISKIEKETNEFNLYMENTDPKLWSEILQIKENLKLGKRYNPFIKIPVLYSCILERLVYSSHTNTIIYVVKDYFSKICDVYDKALRALFPKETITPIKQDLSILDPVDKLLSFKSLFGFNSQTFDYTSDINYYLDQIKLNFPKLLPASRVATFAFENSYKYNGLMPFNYKFLSNVIEANPENSPIQIWDYVWKMFSINNDDGIKEFYNSHKDEINTTYDTFYENINGVISKSHVYYKSLETEFLESRKDYLSGTPKSQLPLFNKVQELDTLLKKVGTSYFLFNLLKAATVTVAVEEVTPLSSLNSLYNILSYTNDFKEKEKENENKVIETLEKDWSYNLYEYIMIEQVHHGNEDLGRACAKATFEYLSVISLIKDLVDVVNQFKGVTDAMSLVPGLGAVCLLIDAALFLIDIFVPDVQYKSYIYKSGNDQFIWDGGKVNVFFFGIASSYESDIKSMKILDPIQVSYPRAYDFYYLNGKHFEKTNERELLYEYARLIANREIKSNKIKKNYTLTQYSNLSYSEKKEDIFDNLDDLVNYVYDYVFVKNKTDKYLSDYKLLKFSSGNIKTTIPVTSNKQDAINKVVSLIKPTQIAMLPKLDQYDYPLTSNDGNLDDGSINQYILPGDSYDIKTGTIIKENTKTNNNQYIIVDPNLNTNNSSNITEIINNPKKELEQRFINSFNVDSKVVYEVDTIGVNKFSDLNYQAETHLIYKASSPYGETKYFLNKEYAFNWLMSKLNINYIENKKEETVYVYNGKENKMFYSIEEFNKWIKENTVVIGGK